MPHLILIATGGTIAGAAASSATTTGYRAGALDVSELLAALPPLAELASIECERLFALDSKDMGPPHWLALARAVEAARSRPDCDGVVITHGTDTLEESAFFLDLVLAPGKPVVLTAAMRPATALSADGPMNLLQACTVASDPAARGRGVLVVAADRIHAARWLAKADTHSLLALDAPGRCALGHALPVRFELPPFPATAPALPLQALDGRDDLPAVEVFYVGAGSAPALLAQAPALGLAGAVLAFPGNGSVPDAWLAAIRAAHAAGLALVRASRVARGGVSPLPAEHPLADTLRCAGPLDAAKARVALMLALTAGGAVTSVFDRLLAR